MNSALLIRLILALLGLEAGICTVFLAEEWGPLRHREEGLFGHFLSATRMGKQFVMDPSPNDERMRFVRPLKDGTLRPILRVDVDEDPERHFESYPLSPIDWAVLLKNAHTFGSRIAAIEQPLTWEDADELPLRALDNALADFDQAVLTVDLRRAAIGQALPPWLRRNAIPIDNVRGNAGLMPRVNRLGIAPSATGADNALFAFRVLESGVIPGESPVEGGVPAADKPRFIPAFAVWDDILIPSFPVAVAMAQFGVGPDEVRILLGEHIRIGADGPIIAIDEFGQLAYRLVEQPLFLSATADTLIDPDFLPKAFPSGAPPAVVFADATGSNPAAWGNASRLQRFISSFDALPRPQAGEPHPRFPLWGEIFFLGVVALTAPLCLRFPKALMPVIFVVSILMALVLLGVVLHFQRTWIPLAPVVATGLVGGILAPRMARYLPPKPVRPAKA